MLKKFTILIFVLVVGAMLCFGYGQAQNKLPLFVKEAKPLKAPRPLYVADEIIVKFKPGIKEQAINALYQAHDVKEKHKSDKGKFRVLKIPQARAVEQLVEVFNKHPLVEFAEPNYYAYAAMIPNDPLYSYQWHFDNPVYGGIQMESAWDIETGDVSVVVAVIDTGVAYEDYPAPDHWHIDSYNAYGGSGNSWWCGANTAGWVTEPGYGNGWKDYLQHSFDLTNAVGSITLSYQYRHDLEVTKGIAYDKAFTEVSTDGGESWAILKTYIGFSRSNQTNHWKEEIIDFSSYVGENILLRFRFNSDEIYSDEDGYFNSDGAIYIDEIKLEDDTGTLFYDNVGSGAGSWQTTEYKQAPDFANTNFIAGYDFVNDDTHANDDDGHGTHVAGTIAQTTNNNLGVAGIAFNTTIMPIKVLGADGSGTYDQVTDGIYYAADNGAKVINMSLSGPAATILEDAVVDAYDSGVTVVAACGNSNASSCEYPAGYDNYVIAVGATQYDQTRAPYSNYGSTLDLVAPGGNTGIDQNSDGYADGVLQQTFSDTPIDWGYWFYQGTSMASPHVAGVAALLLAKDPSLTPSEIRNVLQSTAEDLGATGWDQYYGYGLVDAQAALFSILPEVSITLTTDGLIEYGIMGLGETQDSLGDVQTVWVDAGPANLDIKTSLFADSSYAWSLGSSNGNNQVKWEFSPDSSSWNTFLATSTLYDLANNLNTDNSQDFYFRLTMPTVTDSLNQYSATITIVATAP